MINMHTKFEVSSLSCSGRDILWGLKTEYDVHFQLLHIAKSLRTTKRNPIPDRTSSAIAERPRDAVR